MADNGPVAVLCLGKRLQPDGQPTKMLQLRVTCAVKKFQTLREAGVDAWLIVSGGLVQKGKGCRTEAEVMKEQATKEGVPGSRVIMESKSKTTVENMKMSKIILEQKRFKSVYLVTADFHTPRALIIFQNLIPTIKVEGWGHESGLTPEELNKEKDVEIEMMERYRTRFPDWKFDQSGPIVRAFSERPFLL